MDVPQTHTCEWRDEAERLRGEVTELQQQLAALAGNLQSLQRTVFGKRSEKMPPVGKQLRGDKPASPDEALKKRRANKAARAAMPEREVHHAVPAEDKVCPKCGGTDFRPLGEGKRTVVYEYVPAHLEKQVHVQETLSCRCGECVLTAPAPKAVEGGQYGPGLMAHVVVSKCLDSTPLYRQARALARAGVPVHRNTLGDLFHAAADSLEPLYRRLLDVIRVQEYVQADETPQRVLEKGKTRKGYVWTFRAGKLVAYVHAHGRSGETAVSVLGGTRGWLQVDGYTGYNAVTVPEGRVRVGCWAHVRRKFFDALPTAPEAQAALDGILALYRVEADAEAAGTLGTEAHLQQRRAVSASVVQRLAAWMAEESVRHPPKSPLGEAIRYAQGQWPALCRFLEDARLRLDNNPSEQALRKVALGRKNYLFVGHDEAGANLAGLMSLLATCEENGVNPEVYVADVLMRVNHHPASKLDELLPHRWGPLSNTS